MDLATLVGLIASFGLIGSAMVMGGHASAFLDIPSVLIVFGGTIGVGLIGFPLGDVLSSFRVAANAFRVRTLKPAELIEKLVRLAGQARRDGVLVLETLADRETDPFLGRCLKMVVDGHDRESLESLITMEISSLRERHRKGSEIFQTLGTFAPALGLIGTLIGLIQMLGSLEDASTIGPSMAVALITTFYGAVLANVFFLPISGKLRRRSQEETLIKEMIFAGILSLATGEHPRLVEQKLQAFLAPSHRVKPFETEAAVGRTS